jgi:hypothetical protein
MPVRAHPGRVSDRSRAPLETRADGTGTCFSVAANGPLVCQEAFGESTELKKIPELLAPNRGSGDLPTTISSVAKRISQVGTTHTVFSDGLQHTNCLAVGVEGLLDDQRPVISGAGKEDPCLAHDPAGPQL